MVDDAESSRNNFFSDPVSRGLVVEVLSWIQQLEFGKSGGVPSSIKSYFCLTAKV